MKHPERDAWIPFLFGEATPETKRELAAHLHSCPDCAAEIEGWRRSLGKLDRWELPPAPARQLQPLAPAFRWAAAAAVVLLAGAALDRVTADSALSRETLRAEVAAAVEQAQTRDNSSVAELETRLARASEAQSRQLLQAFTEVLQHARDEDRASLLAVLDRLERDHVADYVALRSDLETVAAAADEELREARRKISQLAVTEQQDPAH